jgi:copper transport protein
MDRTMIPDFPIAVASRRPAGRSRAARAALLALLLLAGWIGGAMPIWPAAAHAFLDTSDPAANAVLSTAPAEATLRFTEPLEQSYSQAELFDENGNKIAGTSTRFGSDGSTMIMTLPSGLKHGTYSILWRSLSAADGHTAQGYFAFTIGAEADVRTIVPPPATEATIGPPDWLKAISRWAALLGLASVVAIWPVWLFVLRPAISPAWQLGPRLTRRVRGFAVAAVAFAIVANLFALVIQALGVGGGAGLAGAVVTTVGQTRYGSLWLLRIGLLLVFAAVLLGVAWWRPWRRPATTIAALILAAALPLPFSLISHAAAQPEGAATAVAFDAVHLLGASVWTGGVFLLVWSLFGILGALTPAGRRVVLLRALPRFSLLALIAWAAMGLTGLYSAWLQVGNLTALRTTEYGQTLILKLVLLTPLFLLGAFNLLIVTRRIGRATTEEAASGWSTHFLTAIVAEAILLLLVFGAVGFLTGDPPARETLQQSAGRLTIPLSANGESGTLYLTPGATGPNHYRLELGSGHEAHLRSTAGLQALLRFELPGQNTGQSQIELVPAAGGAFEGHGSELSIAGDWTIEAIVRGPGQPDWDATVQQQIGTTPPQVDLPPPPPRFGAVGIAGLLLIVGGMAALLLAVWIGRTPIRREATGLGVVGLAVGALLLIQARLAPTADDTSAGVGVALAAPDQAAVTRGSALFAANCVVCHGADGKGDGPAAATMKVKPADLSAIHAMAHSDVDLAYWINNGIAVGGMPGFGDKLDDGQVTDLIAYLRSIQQAALAQRNAPGAEACTVAPRTLDQVRALAPDPGGTPVFPVAAATPLATPEAGAPADAATIQGVTATMRQLVACSNAGDIMRRLALYTDARVRQAYPNGPTPALQAMAATPIPVSELEKVALLDVRDVRQLADGRVTATVVLDNPALHTHGLATPGVNSQQDVARLTFIKQDGRWLIDDLSR